VPGTKQLSFRETIMSDKIECNATKAEKRDENRDPLSGTHGAHPVGTGVGAATGGIAAGAATGAVVGTMAGPVGTLAGAAIGAAAGAVVGGLAGKGVAEEINPTIEHNYWRINYVSRPYAKSGVAYDEYAPAYQYGWESYARYDGKQFVEVESKLESGWNSARGKSKLGWNHAKDAVRDSWDRVSHRVCTPKSSCSSSQK